MKLKLHFRIALYSIQNRKNSNFQNYWKTQEYFILLIILKRLMCVNVSSNAMFISNTENYEYNKLYISWCRNAISVNEFQSKSDNIWLKRDTNISKFLKSYNIFPLLSLLCVNYYWHYQICFILMLYVYYFHLRYCDRVLVFEIVQIWIVSTDWWVIVIIAPSIVNCIAKSREVIRLV